MIRLALHGSWATAGQGIHLISRQAELRFGLHLCLVNALGRCGGF